MFLCQSVQYGESASTSTRTDMPMSPTQTIHFDPAGGALSVLPSAGQAAAGSYGLLLLEHDGVTIVAPSPFKAQFGSATTNTHKLPGDAKQNDGRILDLVASVGLMDATRAYAVHLTVMQGGKALGTVSDTGQDTGSGKTHESELFVALSAVGPVMALARSGSANRTMRNSESAPSRASRRLEVRKQTRRILHGHIDERSTGSKGATKKRSGETGEGELGTNRKTAPRKRAAKRGTR